MTENVHTPTNAGPDQPAVEPAPVTADMPTQTHPTPPWSPPTPGSRDAGAGDDAPAAVPPSASTFTRPAGSALLGDEPAAAPAPGARPEMLVGGAFAGGFLAALILKRVGR